jgi:hypothetical protein
MRDTELVYPLYLTTAPDQPLDVVQAELFQSNSHRIARHYGPVWSASYVVKNSGGLAGDVETFTVLQVNEPRLVRVMAYELDAGLPVGTRARVRMAVQSRSTRVDDAHIRGTILFENQAEFPCPLSTPIGERRHRPFFNVTNSQIEWVTQEWEFIYRRPITVIAYAIRTEANLAGNVDVGFYASYVWIEEA